jgi:uncharacterized protein (TIGR03643 family)
LHDLPDTWPRARRPARPKPCVDPAALNPATIGEVIEMALSDHTTFDAIRDLHGLSADQVKSVMRTALKPGSYRAWRRRIEAFGARHARYK